MNAEINRVIRRARALALAAVLAILLAAPVAHADTSYEILPQHIDYLCVPFLANAFALRIPVAFPDDPFDGFFSDASLIENVPGDFAVLSATAVGNTDPNSGITIEVEARMNDSDSCELVTVSAPTNQCENPVTQLSYQCFSSWSGTLKVVAHSDHPALVGAVYSITGTAPPGVTTAVPGDGPIVYGSGASVFTYLKGLRGEFSAQLDDPASFPALPESFQGGDLRIAFQWPATATAARADASVIGTWQGTLDCIGHVGQQASMSTTSDTSRNATLLIR